MPDDNKSENSIQVKNIGFWGGLSLIIGAITGPGMVTIPLLFQTAGWVTSTFMFLLIMVLSTIVSLLTVEVMSKIPNNDKFQDDVEFNTLVYYFLHKRYHAAIQIIFFLSLQANNVASIIISAQVMDDLLITMFGQTCGLQAVPSFAWICVERSVNATGSSLQSSAFGSSYMLLTGGLLVSLILIGGFGFMDLSDNVVVQLMSFFLLLAILLVWIVTFFTKGFDTTMVPAFGDDQSNLVGMILFNYAFTQTVPSFVNAKRPTVSVQRTLWTSTIISTGMYLAIGILGGMAFQLSNTTDILSAINNSPQRSIVSLITNYLFPLGVLLTSIPVNTIIARYNLVTNGFVKKKTAMLLSTLLPWALAIPMQTGPYLNIFNNIMSLTFNAFANFIVPLALYITYRKGKDLPREIPPPTEEELEEARIKTLLPQYHTDSDSDSDSNFSVQLHVDYTITPSMGQSRKKKPASLHLQPSAAMELRSEQQRGSDTPPGAGSGTPLRKPLRQLTRRKSVDASNMAETPGGAVRRFSLSQSQKLTDTSSLNPSLQELIASGGGGAGSGSGSGNGVSGIGTGVSDVINSIAPSTSAGGASNSYNSSIPVLKQPIDEGTGDNGTPTPAPTEAQLASISSPPPKANPPVGVDSVDVVHTADPSVARTGTAGKEVTVEVSTPLAVFRRSVTVAPAESGHNSPKFSTPGAYGSPHQTNALGSQGHLSLRSQTAPQDDEEDDDDEIPDDIATEFQPLPVWVKIDTLHIAYGTLAAFSVAILSMIIYNVVILAEGINPFA